MRSTLPEYRGGPPVGIYTYLQLALTFKDFDELLNAGSEHSKPAGL